MSSTSVSELDGLIERATSESIPFGELDLPVALEVSDVIRSRSIGSKDAMRCLKKRINKCQTNPNTLLSSWRLVEVCIKNGGAPFIKEICSKEFMDSMEHTISRKGNIDELKKLVCIMLIQLYHTFKNDSQYQYVTKVYERLKNKGVTFPEYSIDHVPSAMFDSRTPAEWMDSDACMICSKKFSLLTRRHHCRSCGGIFCQDHSSHSIPLPDLGIHEPVRVCDDCFEDYELKKQPSGGKKRHGKSKHRHKSRHHRDDDDDEDELLKKAIELSLKETRGSTEPVIPVIDSKLTQKVTQDEANDSDLKAAIEESLREAELAKQRAPPPMPAKQGLTANDTNDIYLFASLVERMKTKTPNEIMADSQLQMLYQKILRSKFKLNSSLNDAAGKYNTLIDMNGKISSSMNMYEEILERQLQNISITQKMSMTQMSSNPYDYYAQQTLPERDYDKISQPIVQSPKERQAPIKEPAISQLQDIEISHDDGQPSTMAQANVQPNIMLPSEPDYEEEVKEAETQAPPIEPKKDITTFDFPTVPIQKVNRKQEAETPVEEEEEEEEEEELLLEL